MLKYCHEVEDWFSPDTRRGCLHETVGKRHDTNEYNLIHRQLNHDADALGLTSKESEKQIITKLNLYSVAYLVNP